MLRFLFLFSWRINMMNKVQALFMSRRFWIAVAGVTFVIFDGMGLGLTEEQTRNLVVVVAGWVVGDSIRVT
jgi:hypothetical protein